MVSNKEFINSWLVIFWWIGTWGFVNSLLKKFKFSIDGVILVHALIMILALASLYLINGSFNHPISTIM